MAPGGCLRRAHRAGGVPAWPGTGAAWPAENRSRRLPAGIRYRASDRPSPPAGSDRRPGARRARGLAPVPRFALVETASSIVGGFKLAAAQPHEVVLDLRSVAHIPDGAHVTAFLVLICSRNVDPASPMLAVRPGAPHR